MSTLSQFLGGIPVGATMRHPDLAPLLTLADSSEWLRAGAFASASSYPRAAALAHLRGISVNRINATFGASSVAAASNGSGTILANPASATNIDRSTDGGVTWSSVAISASLGGNNTHAVFYLNGKFWAIANTTTTIYVAESTTGAAGTWTQRAVATSTTGLTASTAIMDWTGTNYVIAVQSSSATSIWTSPDGITWTVRAVTLSSTIGMAASATGGTVTAQRGDFYHVSTDHGVTWTAVLNAPGTINSRYRAVFSVGNRFFTNGSNSASIVSTTTPADSASWTKVDIPVARLNAAASNIVGTEYGHLSADRSAFYCHAGSAAPGLLRFSDDASVDFIPTDRNAVSTTTAALVVDSSRVVFLNGTTNCSRADCGFANPNAVSIGFDSALNGATVPDTVYVRIA